MPALRPRELIEALIDAFQQSQAPAVLLSPSIAEHPRRLLVQTPAGNVEVWIYIWTLTHGGRVNLPDEYRIQMTTVRPPLESNPNGYTALLGYEPSIGVFAGFDIDRHGVFTPGSSSVQVNINCLHAALQSGFGFDRKTNDEIAVGVRPDQLTNYIANARELHRHGSRAQMYQLLTQAAALQDIPQNVVAQLPQARQRVVRRLSQLARDGAFKHVVLTAYGHRCAVTRVQLRLVDAAHILPVGVPGSIDDIRNGVALSPTYHRAFDHGLIYLDENYFMQLNPQQELQLTTLNLQGGLPDFRNFLGRRIHLPPDQRQWPEIRFIREANRHRRVG
jgi:putative restriction endonuclease